MRHQIPHKPSREGFRPKTLPGGFPPQNPPGTLYPPKFSPAARRGARLRRANPPGRVRNRPSTNRPPWRATPVTSRVGCHWTQHGHERGGGTPPQRAARPARHAPLPSGPGAPPPPISPPILRPTRPAATSAAGIRQPVRCRPSGSRATQSRRSRRAAPSSSPSSQARRASRCGARAAARSTRATCSGRCRHSASSRSATPSAGTLISSPRCAGLAVNPRRRRARRARSRPSGRGP